jgi:hypothetical protein
VEAQAGVVADLGPTHIPSRHRGGEDRRPRPRQGGHGAGRPAT